jgi:hypothetical protein
MSDLGEQPKLTFSDEEVRAVLGKRVLVGITHRTLKGEVESLEQFWGVAQRVNLREGLVLKLASFEERALPPDLSRLEPASPGNYRLKDTGEVVVDPDFTVMWTHYPKGYSGEA